MNRCEFHTSWWVYKEDNLAHLAYIIRPDDSHELTACGLLYFTSYNIERRFPGVERCRLCYILALVMELGA